MVSCFYCGGGEKVLQYGKNNERRDFMSEILEILMVLSFGASWPLNLWKNYHSRTAVGKSLGFLLLIFFGYVAGIASKLVSESYMASFSQKWYVLFFYCLNLMMVGANICIHLRNVRLDKMKEETK